MTEASELQSEEIEVLKSIYEGDEQFSILSETQFQYKYGTNGSHRSFILQIAWPPEYPLEAPQISMDMFYNAHIDPSVSEAVKASVENEIEQYLGMSMTYSLFEHVKENYEEFIANQPEEEQEGIESTMESLQLESSSGHEEKKDTVKKEKLTKAQKRRMWNRGGINETDRPRGWDWVDIIRHLSQTGSKEDDNTA